MLEKVNISNPLVSILIPCYNHEMYLEDSLESILRQSYDNIELVLCDDCSTDKSFEIALGYEERLKRKFKYVKLLKNEENLGVTRTLNKLLDKARGEIIKPIASDDYMHESYIASIVKEFRNNESIDVVVTDGFWVNEDDHIGENKDYDKFYKKRPNFAKKNLVERIYRENFIFAPGVAIKKSVFDKYGSYDESVRIEDWELWLRLAKEGNVQFKFLDIPLIYYRRNANSATSLTGRDLETRRKRLYDSEIQIIEKYRREVSARVFVNKKFEIVFREMRIANTKNLLQMSKCTRDAMDELLGNKYLNLKNRLLYLGYKIII